MISRMCDALQVVPTLSRKTGATAVLLLALTSCNGSGDALYPVQGKATYKGQPAAGAYIVLVRDGPATPGAKPAAVESPPAATVEQDGRFTLMCGDRGSGAPPGKYKVMIDWRTDSVPTRSRPR